MVTVAYVQTPLGRIRLTACSGKLIRCRWQAGKNRRRRHSADPTLRQTARELDLYFKGRLNKFGVPVRPAGTVFQQKVWSILQKIPYGKTVSYARLAKLASYPKAVRAVANAMAANPIPILVPCHRVIRSSGGLGGYAGGIYRKKWLLAHEGRRCRGVTNRLA